MTLTVAVRFNRTTDSNSSVGDAIPLITTAYLFNVSFALSLRRAESELPVGKIHNIMLKEETNWTAVAARNELRFLIF